ncbi:MAG: hypothetical protein M0C28_25225 [Candidatus Moduliflexus flocculans]|nr:hypothetical protein [Candidatus Moduliflexus flocculans]
MKLRLRTDPERGESAADVTFPTDFQGWSGDRPRRARGLRPRRGPDLRGRERRGTSASPARSRCVTSSRPRRAFPTR